MADLFAGKMHAVLCRKWKVRVKGRDWYDIVWFVSHHPQLHLLHLESRMRKSGDWEGANHLDEDSFRTLLAKKIDELDVDKARSDIEPFLKNPGAVEVWSTGFFHDASQRIRIV
jgi:hypothetical protein